MPVINSWVSFMRYRGNMNDSVNIEVLGNINTDIKGGVMPFGCIICGIK